VFLYQCGATFGYTQETNALNFETCEWSAKVETDLIPLKKFVQELLRGSKSTCSTLLTAICYVEAIRHKIKVAQDNEQGGRGIRGDQVNNDGRIVIDVTVQVANCQRGRVANNSNLGRSQSWTAGDRDVSWGLSLMSLLKPISWTAPRQI
jgi:hypothetical protein